MHCRGHTGFPLSSSTHAAIWVPSLHHQLCVWCSQLTSVIIILSTGTALRPQGHLLDLTYSHLPDFIFTSALWCCPRLPHLPYYTYSPQTPPFSSTGISFFTLSSVHATRAPPLGIHYALLVSSYTILC